MGPQVAVVIPFFQREHGILSRALHSVALQTVPARVRVVVVDDASPVPARPEVESARARGLEIHLIERPNAGPGGARNAGLDWAVALQADFVAFLDSDDRWRPAHLDRALRALSAGDDVYFSNLIQLGSDQPAFERGGRLRVDAHRLIDAADGLRHYSGDMITQIVTGNLIGTSSVVYRVQRFPDLRFRTRFRRAGEDYLFWIGLATRGATFCFGVQPMVDYGRGINIYAGAGWGTEGFARRLFDELNYRRACERELLHSPDVSRHLRAEKLRLTRAFWADLRHRLWHRKPVDWSLVIQFVKLRLGADV